MKRAKLTRLAVADLDNIWDYTFRTWGFAQAEHYIGLIRGRLQGAAEGSIADQPSGLSGEPDRKISVGSHKAFFTRRNYGIEVARILHERMDISHHLK